MYTKEQVQKFLLTAQRLIRDAHRMTYERAFRDGEQARSIEYESDRLLMRDIKDLGDEFEKLFPEA